MPAAHISTDGCEALSAIQKFPMQCIFSLKPKIFRCSEKFPEPGIFENLEISRFCEKASFCNPLLHFEVAESESEVQIAARIFFYTKKTCSRNCAKHSPQSGQNAKSLRPKSPMKISTCNMFL